MNLDPELQGLLLLVLFSLGAGALLAAPAMLKRYRSTGKWFPAAPSDSLPAWQKSPAWIYLGIGLFGCGALLSFLFLDMPYYGGVFLLFAAFYVRLWFKHRHSPGN